MPGDNDDVLLRLAESVVDGVPVDWEAQRLADERMKSRLGSLRLLEAIAVLHRSSAVSESGEKEAERQTGPHPASSWGPLQILELIGSGGFGEVYRAYDPSLQREVALKLRRADRGQDGLAAERFLGEARRLARVRHPNVLVVHGADRHGGRVGLWTDLLKGRTLEECLAQQGPFGAHEAALIGIDLCRALAAVHAAGLVHRDVKTSNVMREQGGRIVLMDFGCVAERLPGEAPGSQPISGTPLFMAPEQLRGDPPSPTSDIYSLGVVLYRLVSGRYPVEASTASELLDKHRRGERVPLRDVRPDLPMPFAQLVERALAPDPDRRYASAGAMDQVLAASLGSPAAETATAPPGLRVSRRAVWLSLAAAILAAVCSAWLLGRTTPHPFSAEAKIYRLAEGREERLLAGARIRPGDRLFLEVEGHEKMYVYVLNEDVQGSAFVLFPAGLDLDNPLPPGVRHRLPGEQNGRQMSWEVTSPGGREEFLVIASRRPLENLDRELARLPRAREGHQVAYAPLSAGSLQKLRGVGGLAEATPPPADGSEPRLSGIARALSAESSRTSGIWTWQIELDNPSE